ncbi:HtaA domain-containing protein [Streptomyces sp. GLT-R25]
MAANRRRPIALAAACATAVTLGATALAATSASAAEVPLKGYEFTWGIKQSYRTYVTGMAAGSFTPEGGATQAKDNGAFTFVNGTGTYDSEAHTVALGFEGSLKIVSKLHGFELALSDAEVRQQGRESHRGRDEERHDPAGRAARRGHRHPHDDGHGDQADEGGG